MSKNQNPLSASAHPVIREALLRDFYSHFETKFAKIWNLVKGGTDKTLIGPISRDDLALCLFEIVAPARLQFDPSVFKERQEIQTHYSIPVLQGESYSDVVTRGIKAARAAADNLAIFISSLLALNLPHIQLTSQFLNHLSVEIPNAEIDYFKFIGSLAVTQRNIMKCQLAVRLATGQRVGRRGQGRPPSKYTLLAVELGRLWEKLNGRKIPTPKSTGRANTKSNSDIESTQTSTQFVWLAMTMVNTNVKLQEAETAIRNAIPILRLIDETTNPKDRSKLITKLFEWKIFDDVL